MTEHKKAWTRQEVATTLGISLRTVDRRIGDGTIRTIRLGGRAVRITDDEVQRILKGEAPQ